MRALVDHLRGVFEKLHAAGFRCMLKLIELGWVPDFVTRMGIRHLLSLRLQDVRAFQTSF